MTGNGRLTASPPIKATGPRNIWQRSKNTDHVQFTAAVSRRCDNRYGNCSSPLTRVRTPASANSDGQWAVGGRRFTLLAAREQAEIREDRNVASSERYLGTISEMAPGGRIARTPATRPGRRECRPQTFAPPRSEVSRRQIPFAPRGDRSDFPRR